MPPEARAAGAGHRAILIGSWAATAAACWWVLARHGGAAHRVLAPHPASDATAAYPAAFGMWLVMSVAMMLPPLLPWLLVTARTSAAGGPGGGRRVAGSEPLVHAAAFAAGYFVLWIGYSAAAAAAQLAAQAVVTVDLAARGLGGVAGGAVLAAAGLAQLTPLKRACLARCRSPIAFFLAHWRPGAPAALAMGARHGLHCLGCCWALMAVAFGVGVMNLAWMALLTAAVVAEQTVPRGDVLARVLGAGLVAWGLVVMA